MKTYSFEKIFLFYIKKTSKISANLNTLLVTRMNKYKRNYFTTIMHEIIFGNFTIKYFLHD